MRGSSSGSSGGRSGFRMAAGRGDSVGACKICSNARATVDACARM